MFVKTTSYGISINFYQHTIVMSYAGVTVARIARDVEH